MDVAGEFVIPAPRARVWEMLNDAEVLRRCIPGCREIEKLSPNELAATATLKVGPVKATFRGKVTLLDIDPPNGYRLSGEGQGGAAGFARGEAVVRLADADDGGTRLTYDAHATVGGKLAQIGQRLLDSTARKLAGDFFAKFSEIAGAAPEAAEAAPEVVAEAPAPAAIGPWLWIGGLLVLVVILLILFGI